MTKSYMQSIFAVACCTAAGLAGAAPPLALTTNHALTVSLARHQAVVNTGNVGGPGNLGTPRPVMIQTPAIAPSVQSEIDALVTTVLQAGNAQLLLERFGSSAVNLAGEVCDLRAATGAAGTGPADRDPAQCGLTVMLNGSMMVAPGKSIEISDRGSDGLRFVITAPEDAPLEVTRLLTNVARNGMLSALKPARGTASNVVVENDGRILLKNGAVATQ